MDYRLKFQLRDSERSFPSEQARDNAYDTVMQQMIAWGIPESNIILTKTNVEICDLGYEHSTLVE